MGLLPTPGVWTTLKFYIIFVVTSGLYQIGWGNYFRALTRRGEGCIPGRDVGPQFKRERGGNGGKGVGRKEGRANKWRWAEQTQFPSCSVTGPLPVAPWIAKELRPF